MGKLPPLEKRMRKITDQKKICFNQVKSTVFELQKKMETSNLEVSFIFSKGTKLKEDNTGLFDKSDNPYQTLELGVWEQAIESQLLIINDTFMCRNSCTHCKNKLKTQTPLNDEEFEMTTKTQFANTPSRNSSLLVVQSPGEATPTLAQGTSKYAADDFLKSPKDTKKKTKAKLIRRRETDIARDNTEDLMSTPIKKRPRSPNNNILKDAPLYKIDTPKMAIKYGKEGQCQLNTVVIEPPKAPTDQSSQHQGEVTSSDSAPEQTPMEVTTQERSDPLSLGESLMRLTPGEDSIDNPKMVIIDTGNSKMLEVHDESANVHAITTPAPARPVESDKLDKGDNQVSLLDPPHDTPATASGVPQESEVGQKRTSVPLIKGENKRTAPLATPIKRKIAEEEDADLNDKERKRQNISNSPEQSYATMAAKPAHKNKLNVTSWQMKTEKNEIRKDLHTKRTERENTTREVIEVKVSVTENKPYTACSLHEKNQLLPLLENNLKIKIHRATAIHKKNFVLLKIHKDNSESLVSSLETDGEVLIKGPNGATIIITPKWPHRVIIKEVRTEINLDCLKTDIEADNSIRIENIVRLGRSTTVKLDIIGKKPPTVLKISTLGKLIIREVHEYKEKVKYCLKCLSFAHEKHQCREAPRCQNCIGRHYTSECTAKTSQYRCFFCPGNPNHASRRCQQIYKTTNVSSTNTRSSTATFSRGGNCQNNVIPTAAPETSMESTYIPAPTQSNSSGSSNIIHVNNSSLEEENKMLVRKNQELQKQIFEMHTQLQLV